MRLDGILVPRVENVRRGRKDRLFSAEASRRRSGSQSGPREARSLVDRQPDNLLFGGRRKCGHSRYNTSASRACVRAVSDDILIPDARKFVRFVARASELRAAGDLCSFNLVAPMIEVGEVQTRRVALNGTIYLFVTGTVDESFRSPGISFPSQSVLL